MKVLLTAVNAKYIHSNLAVYDLRAYAEAYGTGGAQVEIGEYTINHTIDYILEGIYKGKARCALLFLLYLESGLCGTADGRVPQDLSRSADLGRRPGSVL